MKCEREQQVIQSTRSGSTPQALRIHLQECASCMQTELLAESLQEMAATTIRTLDLPPAGLVWRRAQALRRQREIHRATRRPFAIVGALGAIYSVAFLLWSIFQLPESIHHVFIMSPAWNQNLAIAGALFSTLLAIVGSCVFLLKTELRP